MAYGNVLVHRGQRIRIEADGSVDGDRAEREVLGATFRCCLFPEQSARDREGNRRRETEGPLLLLAPLDDEGEPLDLSARDAVYVTAPEILVPGWVRFELTGAPQQFGRPGRTPVGAQVTVRRVVD